MATRAQLEQALKHPNVRKMLELISYTEGTRGNGYHTAFGGGRLASLRDHPRYSKSFRETTGRTNTTSAAGKYQFLKGTWDGVARQYGLNDFGPHNQDLAAVALLFSRGAIPALLKGDFQTAVQKTGKEWASLPSSTYAQGKKSWASVNKFLGGAISPVSSAVGNDGGYQARQAPPDPRLSMSMFDLAKNLKGSKGKRSDNEMFIELANNNGRAGQEVRHLIGQGINPMEIARQLGLGISVAQTPQPEQQPTAPPSYEDFAANYDDAPIEPTEPPSFEEFSASYEQEQPQIIEPVEPPSFEDFAASYEPTEDLMQTGDTWQTQKTLSDSTLSEKNEKALPTLKSSWESLS